MHKCLSLAPQIFKEQLNIKLNVQTIKHIQNDCIQNYKGKFDKLSMTFYNHCLAQKDNIPLNPMDVSITFAEHVALQGNFITGVAISCHPQALLNDRHVSIFKAGHVNIPNFSDAEVTCAKTLVHELSHAFDAEHLKKEDAQYFMTIQQQLFQLSERFHPDNLFKIHRCVDHKRILRTCDGTIKHDKKNRKQHRVICRLCNTKLGKTARKKWRKRWHKE